MSIPSRPRRRRALTAAGVAVAICMLTATDRAQAVAGRVPSGSTRHHSTREAAHPSPLHRLVDRRMSGQGLLGFLRRTRGSLARYTIREIGGEGRIFTTDGKPELLYRAGDAARLPAHKYDERGRKRWRWWNESRKKVSPQEFITRLGTVSVTGQHVEIDPRSKRTPKGDIVKKMTEAPGAAYHFQVTGYRNGNPVGDDPYHSLIEPTVLDFKKTAGDPRIEVKDLYGERSNFWRRRLDLAGALWVLDSLKADNSLYLAELSVPQRFS